jgi:tellurite resistance protein TerA
LEDGQKGAIQALGRNFGALDRAPFVKLAGDDRSGDSADGEWMHVSGAQWPRIKRILVYAFIYEGVPNWAATDGVVSITVQGQPPIEVRLDEGSGLGTCAIALLENVAGNIRVNREVKYFPEAEKMDKAYRWGMRWSAGSK